MKNANILIPLIFPQVMQDITEAVRSKIRLNLQTGLLIEGWIFRHENFMTNGIYTFNSLEDLTTNYNSNETCFARIENIRYRDPNRAYKELTGKSIDSYFTDDQIILHDRIGSEWCFALQSTSWLKKGIKDFFSDYDVLDYVFGKIEFENNNTIKQINTMSYGGRIPKKEKSSIFKPRFQTAPSY